MGGLSFSFHGGSFILTPKPPLAYALGRRQGAMASPKFLAYLVILRFEKQRPKQNTATSLKSNILAPPKFSDGYATV